MPVSLHDVAMVMGHAPGTPDTERGDLDHQDDHMAISLSLPDGADEVGWRVTALQLPLEQNIGEYFGSQPTHTSKTATTYRWYAIDVPAGVRGLLEVWGIYHGVLGAPDRYWFV